MYSVIQPIKLVSNLSPEIVISCLMWKPVFSEHGQPWIWAGNATSKPVLNRSVPDGWNYCWIRKNWLSINATRAFHDYWFRSEDLEKNILHQFRISSGFRIFQQLDYFYWVWLNILAKNRQHVSLCQLKEKYIWKDLSNKWNENFRNVRLLKKSVQLLFVITFYLCSNFNANVL